MAAKKTIFIYPGQGSQYYNMGIDLFEKNDLFRHWMEALDREVMSYANYSVLEEIYTPGKGITDPLDNILFTNPSIFMVSYALTKVLMDRGYTADYLLGSSLGEYTALTVAEVFDYRETIRLLVDSAKSLKELCEGGSMLAVLAEKNYFQKNPEIFQGCEFAADNFSQHFVVSGKLEVIQKTEELLKSSNINYQRLPVNIAFHSSHIDVFEKKYKSRSSDLKAKKPKYPIISCTTTSINPNITGDFLWDIVREPINFQRTIDVVEKEFQPTYIDLGPSGTLATFVNYCIKSKGRTFSIVTPFGGAIDKIENLPDPPQTKPLLKKSTKSKEMKTYMFPGQGSQRKGMGEGLFDNFPDMAESASDTLGMSIKDLCLNDPNRQLVQTENAQVAIFTVNAMHYLNQVGTIGKPDIFIGHSLGEFNALWAAGAFDFETGLKIVRKRGLLMAGATGGGMAAVIGLEEEKLRSALKTNGFESIDFANFNSPHQIVISGPKEDILAAAPFVEKSGAMAYVPLNVSGAFHSRYMQPSADEFETFISNMNFNNLEIPVISNVSARKYDDIKIKEGIVKQIVSPVKWNESIRYLMGLGCNEFVEIGEGDILKKLVAQVKRNAQPLIVEEKEVINKEIPVTSVSKKSTRSSKIENQKKSSIKVKAKSKKLSPTITEDLSNGQNGLHDVEPTTNRKTKSVLTTSAQLSEKIKFQKSTQNKITAESDMLEELNKETGGLKTKKNGKVDKLDLFSLGSESYKKAYKTKFAYSTGSMHYGISSRDFVRRLSGAGYMSYFGSDGLRIEEIEEAIVDLKRSLGDSTLYGFNLRYSPYDFSREERLVDLYLKHRINKIEASSYLQVTKSLVKYRLAGLTKNKDGSIISGNRIKLKASRPEIIELFLSPAPDRVVQNLLERGEISVSQASWSKYIPLATDICVSADAGGDTDKGNPVVIFPAIKKLHNKLMQKYQYQESVNIGIAGGIGTPEAAAAAFLLGADFIMTGSINLCTVEANISSVAKGMIDKINVQDTDYAPAEDMFELGAIVQVLKRGVFFSPRANKLLELYRQHDSLNQINGELRTRLERRYFKKSLEEVYEDCKKVCSENEIRKANSDPKFKMILVFKQYLRQGVLSALKGDESNKVNFQIYCSPALGAFNQWVKETELKDWQNRHVDDIASKLLSSSAEYLNNFMKVWKS